MNRRVFIEKIWVPRQVLTSANEISGARYSICQNCNEFFVRLKIKNFTKLRQPFVVPELQYPESLDNICATFH